MRIEFTGRDVTPPSAFEQYAEKRLARLERFAKRVGTVRVVLSEQRGRKTVEITADLDGTLIRSETRAPEERVAFDSALEKLERQIDRYKTRFQRRRRASRRAAETQGEFAQEVLVEDEGEEEEEEEVRVVRTKTVSLKPMSPEEAVLQMELLGHDFFLFRNADSDLVSVVYRRTAGDYGLIECES